MMNLFVLYNINLVPLAICGPPPHLKTWIVRVGCRGKTIGRRYLYVYKKEEKDNKVNCEVVTKEVSMRRSSGNSMNPKSFQSQVTRKKRMVDEKQCFDDV
jgi:hypothetical protein